tara:strand:- start:25 stop:129 length:105 start_codon:yes stop_codon:yes gene_type:complete
MLFNSMVGLLEIASFLPVVNSARRRARRPSSTVF